MSKKCLYFFFGFLFFLFFIIFSAIVQQNVLTHADDTATGWLQAHIPRVFDTLFSILSLIGSLEITGTFLVIFLIVRRKIVSGVVTLLLFGATHVFELYGKTFIQHPGPPIRLLRYNLSFNFPSALIQPGSSYPSGHAARAFFITTIIGLLTLKSKKLSQNLKRIVVICLILYDFAMCLSRVYLAEHWTTDIIGGMLSGIGLALISATAL